MSEKKFFQTKEGAMTLSFLVIMIAFVLIMVGVAIGVDLLCDISYIVLLLAVLYIPFRTYVLRKK